VMQYVGDISPVPEDAVPGEIDRTRTTAIVFGGAVQLTSTATLFGHNKPLRGGSSVDHGRVNFGATAELGILGPDLFVTGTGFFLNWPIGEAGPVQLLTTKYLRQRVCKRYPRPDAQLSVTAGARYNIAEDSIEDLS